MAGEPGHTQLWEPFVTALPVQGASVCVLSHRGIGSTVSTSDGVAAELDALQLELGEGPRWAAFRSGRPVLVPDVAADGSHAGWPVFGAALARTPARAVFAFPLVLGPVVVGVADLYASLATAAWSDGLVAEAESIAAASAAPAVRLATRSAAVEVAVSPGMAGELRREVHQATGVLVVRLDVGPDEALARLEAYAFSTGRPLLDVARAVLRREVDITVDLG